VESARGRDDYSVGFNGSEHFVLRLEESTAWRGSLRGVQGLVPQIRDGYQTHAGEAAKEGNMDLTPNAATACEGELEWTNR
jgi:hypothetical protein